MIFPKSTNKRKSLRNSKPIFTLGKNFQFKGNKAYLKLCNKCGKQDMQNGNYCNNCGNSIFVYSDILFRIKFCPDCRSLNYMPHTYCENCTSTNLIEIDAIEASKFIEKYQQNKGNHKNFEENLEKGWKFQKYVESLFPYPYFSIEDRTSHYSESQTTRDKFPDLIVRSNECNLSFAVECKYRSKIYQTNEILKDKEKKIFSDFSKNTNTDIFIVVGTGGTPITPSMIYTIPFNNKVFSYKSIFLSKLLEFERKENGRFVFDKGKLK